MRSEHQKGRNRKRFRCHHQLVISRKSSIPTNDDHHRRRPREILLHQMAAVSAASAASAACASCCNCCVCCWCRCSTCCVLRWIRLLFCQLLMFVVLLLLEFLPILVLPSRPAYPAAAGISGPASRSPCSAGAGRSTGGSSFGWTAMLARGVAATGGVPWFAEYCCWGLLRAAHAC